MLAMRQRRQLDRSPHVARIGDRGCQLIQPVVASLDHGCTDQSHTAADRIHRNYVETLALVAGQLAEVGSQQIGQRRGSVDALIPAAKRVL